MMTDDTPTTTLQRFFSGLAESVFQTQLGVADPPLTDYISEMLMRFVRSDKLHRIRSTTGRPLRHVSDMLAEAEARIGEARRDVHRHIGDFTLYWAGLFPEALQRRGSRQLDRFEDYCAHGKRAYLIASSIESAPDEDETASREVLERLGLQFEMCAYGLREVRREWERRDDDMPRPLLFN